MVQLGIGIKIVEILLYIALPSFIGSTWYLIIVVKKTKMKLIKNAMTNPLWPNIDFSALLLNSCHKKQEILCGNF